MGTVARRPVLQRATFRAAALSLWGLGGVVMASNYVGHDLQVNYGIEWIITGSAAAAGLLAWFWPWAALPAQRFLPVVFGGLVINAVSLVATGGVHSHVMPLLMVIVVFSASLFEFRAAMTILVLDAFVATLPLLLQGWDGSYARTLLVLLASMVVCGFVPSMVAAALRNENRLVERQRDELEQSYLATIAALAAALDAKDRHTEPHSREVAALARAVGRRLGLEEQDLRFLEYGALLHDIGTRPVRSRYRSGRPRSRRTAPPRSACWRRPIDRCTSKSGNASPDRRGALHPEPARAHTSRFEARLFGPGSARTT